MVISDEHRYVFIEVPQTASSALAAELIENYGGRRIFRKHTDYLEFHRTASAEERSYRVLATVRNPMDIVVSKFIKARDDHRNSYGSAMAADAPFGHRFRPEAREFAFIARHGADFARYVRKFYRHVYNSRACLLPAHAHVLKYERLDVEFPAWLASVGLELARPLPRRHVTDGRGRDFSEWYQGDLRTHAVRVFSPYMLRWGYAFPADWPRLAPSRSRAALFRADTFFRRFYLRHIHYGWVMPSAKREARAESSGQ
jgi:hypothetical protein